MKMLSKIFFGRGAGPGAVVAATAINVGFWISQMLASYFVGGAIMGTLPKMAGTLLFALFAVLFVLHFLRPESKTAAILGLCSFGAFTAGIAYLSSPGFAAYVPSVELVLLISAGLAMLGIAVDVVHSPQR